MKIVFYSRLFFPAQGGSVSIVDQLAEAWTALGHEVVVVTPTVCEGEAHSDEDSFPYRLQRQADFRALWSSLRDCDVFVSMEVSLKALFPALLLGKKCIVTHQTWCWKASERKKLALARRAQQFVLPLVIQVPCSEAIGQNWGGRYQVIGNPYREQLYVNQGQPRTVDFCFVGRLVADKGVDLFLQALLLQKEGGWQGRALIVGAGPERSAYEQLANELGLAEVVTFTGWQSPAETVILLNQSRILVVPSRWEEPFGMVAVEGLACGCRLIVSSGGGLPDAAGPFSAAFENGNLAQLGELMSMALAQGTRSAAEEREVALHLENFRLERVAKSYLELLR